jgi:hypothetical protein
MYYTPKEKPVPSCAPSLIAKELLHYPKCAEDPCLSVKQLPVKPKCSPVVLDRSTLPGPSMAPPSSQALSCAPDLSMTLPASSTVLGPPMAKQSMAPPSSEAPDLSMTLPASSTVLGPPMAKQRPGSNSPQGNVWWKQNMTPVPWYILAGHCAAPPSPDDYGSP